MAIFSYTVQNHFSWTWSKVVEVPQTQTQSHMSLFANHLQMWTGTSEAFAYIKKKKESVLNVKLLSSKYCCLLVYLTKQWVCSNRSRFTVIHKDNVGLNKWSHGVSFY